MLWLRDAAGTNKRQKVRKRQKVKTYFLPVQKSKKGQAKLALFWRKGEKKPMGAIEGGGKMRDETLAFPSPAWAARVARQGRERVQRGALISSAV
jgi:hypothetical protein